MEIYNENFEEGKASNKRTAKYARYVKILTQVETNLLYKGEIIEGNKELENQQENDIKHLLKIISDELKKEGVKKINVKGRVLKIIEN